MWPVWLSMNGLRKKHTNQNVKKKYIFKQGIGIAEKSQETRRNRWGGNVNHKSLFWLHKMFMDHWVKIRRDLWFTLPPHLVSWLFSAIPIPCLKILFFYHSSLCSAWTWDMAQWICLVMLDKMAVIWFQNCVYKAYSKIKFETWVIYTVFSVCAWVLSCMVPDFRSSTTSIYFTIIYLIPIQRVKVYSPCNFWHFIMFVFLN